MQAMGQLLARAYTGAAQLPLKDAAIAVTAADGTAISMGLTDRSGKIPLISIPVPPLSESQTPDPQERPYTLVNLYARKEGYEQIESENIQIFADTVTIQNLEMVPLSELPDSWDQTMVFDAPPQNL